MKLLLYLSIVCNSFIIFNLVDMLDYNIFKNQADLEFSRLFAENGLKFLIFALKNSNLCYWNTYKHCQFLLLKTENKSKASILTIQKKEFNKI